MSINTLREQIQACTLCEKTLALGARPVVQISRTAKILIAGQAPGAKVHASGVPFDDASGNRLRDWMGLSREQFYDAKQIAILPMGFCYPGKGKSGDLPPTALCAETWRSQVLAMMPDICLTIVIGQYAQAWHLDHMQSNLTETVKNWQAYPNHTLPIAHPSPRNNIWLKKNAWFESELLPVLKSRVISALI